MMQLRAEQSYFLAVLRQMIHPDSREKLEFRPEWIRTLAAAQDQALYPLVFEALSRLEEVRLHPAYEKLFQRAMTQVSVQMQRSVRLAEVYRHLSEQGLCLVLMKGLCCRLLYGEYADFRPSGDEDLLIQREDFPAVRAALLQEGFCVEDKYAQLDPGERIQEVTFTDSQSDLVLEIHLNLVGHENALRSGMEAQFADVFSDLRSFTWEGTTFRALNCTQELMLLILHAFKHFMNFGFGVRMALDILLYYEQHQPQIDRKMLLKRLHAVKADLFFSDLIRIGCEKLGFALDPFLPAGAPEELLQDMLGSSAFDVGDEMHRIAGNLMMAQLAARAYPPKMQRAAAVFRLVFPEKGYLEQRVPQAASSDTNTARAAFERFGRIFRELPKMKQAAGDGLRLQKERRKLLEKYHIFE